MDVVVESKLVENQSWADHKWMFLGGGGTKNAGLKYAAGWMDSMMITAGAAAALS